MDGKTPAYPPHVPYLRAWLECMKCIYLAVILYSPAKCQVCSFCECFLIQPCLDRLQAVVSLLCVRTLVTDRRGWKGNWSINKKKRNWRKEMNEPTNYRMHPSSYQCLHQGEKEMQAEKLQTGNVHICTEWLVPLVCSKSCVLLVYSSFA